MPKPVSRTQPPQQGNRRFPERWNLPTRLHHLPKDSLLSEFLTYAPTACFGCGRERPPDRLRINGNLDFVCDNERECQQNRA